MTNEIRKHERLLVVVLLLSPLLFGVFGSATRHVSAQLGSNQSVIQPAATGDLDPTFGSGGKVITPLGNSNDGATAVASQADGKIVAVGTIRNNVFCFAVARYNTDGSLDSSFGSGGKVITPIGSPIDSASSVAIQADGKIVVAGSSNIRSGEFALVRYTSNGSLDSSFGSGGIVTTRVGSSFAHALSVAIQSDGKIVAAGFAFALFGSNQFALARYHSDGSLDPSFGSSGTVITSVGSSTSEAYAVVIQPDGKIIAGGRNFNGTKYDFALVRYNADGAVDPGFGTGGKVTTPMGTEHSELFSIALQSDGRLVAGGDSYGPGFRNVAMARYNNDGSLDTSFGSAGKVITQLGSQDSLISSVVIQPSGKIIAGGYGRTGADADFAVARYNPDGSPDATFGSGGQTLLGIGNADDVANALALQSNGSIVAAGSAAIGSHFEFALARFQVNGSVDTAFGSGGKVSTAIGTGVSEVFAVVTQSDGKIVAGGSAFTTLTTSSPVAEIDFALVRYNVDGSLDSSFGAGGKVLTAMQANNRTARATIYSLVIQPDGKLVAAGQAETDGASPGNFALARYHTNGSLDSTFGSGGIVTTRVLNCKGARAIAIQPDGKIVAVGMVLGPLNEEFALARYNTNGSLDSSFGTGGQVSTSFSTSSSQRITAEGQAIAIQPDGRIVAAGFLFTGGSNSDFALARYNTDGSLDSSFGTGGKVTTGVGASGSDDEIHSLIIQPDGRIVAGGQGQFVLGGTTIDFALARYNPNGSLDTSFGSAGIAATPIGPGTEAARSLALQPDGKLVAAGTSSNGSNDDFALVRYHANGSLDSSFGSGGKVTTPIGNAKDAGNAMTIQTNGRILVAGSSFNGVNNDFALARYLVDAATPIPSPSPGASPSPGPSPSPNPSPSPSPSPSPATSNVQFSPASYNVPEDCAVITITVNRSGDTSVPASVDFATVAGTASERADYTTAMGTLRFGAGETSKTFDLFISEDSFVEGPENLSVNLSNPLGVALGANPTATITITDDLSEPVGNAIDDVATFVAQHYHDLLNRQHDAAGFAFWSNEILSCGANAGCIEQKRINVSAGYFLSIEFQTTGFSVIRIYKSTFTDTPQRPRGLPRYREFIRDMGELHDGLVVGQGNWQQLLSDLTTSFARGWVQRPEVLALLPTSMNGAQFVDRLFQNNEVSPTTAERDAAIAAFGSGDTNGRAAALLSVINSGSVFNKQYNPAFVLMEYLGYLRRNPDDAPDNNFNGFDFWLNKLNSFSTAGEDLRNPQAAENRVLRAEMVRAFITSMEYRSRFGP